MTHAQQEKIGQLMLWLSGDVPNLYITKLLKLLYLVDETAVRRTGVPVTWLTYKVWKFGPVPPLVYNDLTFHNAETFGRFVQVVIEPGNWHDEEKNNLRVEPAGPLSKGLFSLDEMNIIGEVISKYGGRSARELIDLLHQEDTLWHKIYEKEKLAERFEQSEYNTSPFEIDLRTLLTGDEKKLARYDEMEEFQAFVEAF